MLTEILFILGLVLLNGVFAGAEIAVLSLRKTRLAELVEAGSNAARAVVRLRSDPEAFLATVQIGITVIGATAAAFGGASIAADIAPAFATVPVLAPYADKLALGLVVATVSFLSLVLGELVPKSLALRAGEAYALFIGRPLAALAFVARPLVALLTGASNLVLRLFGDRTTFSETRLSPEELQQMVEEAASAGALDPHAGEIATRALEFSSLDAYTLMVPRADIVAVPRDIGGEAFADLVRSHPHARLPVYEGSSDNIVGVVNVRDVLGAAVRTHEWRLEPLLPVTFVPDTMPAPTLLRKLQGERASIALVLDEQGTIVGLVSVEDLLEELVGELLTENDKAAGAALREPDGAWVVPGNTPVHEVARALSLELPEGDYSTVAGLCITLAGRIPTVGDRLETATGLELEVVDATPRRVRAVRIRRSLSTPSED